MVGSARGYRVIISGGKGGHEHRNGLERAS